jgi:hypothetical protein
MARDQSQFSLIAPLKLHLLFHVCWVMACHVVVDILATIPCILKDLYDDLIQNRNPFDYVLYIQSINSEHEWFVFEAAHSFILGMCVGSDSSGLWVAELIRITKYHRQMVFGWP